DMFDCVIPTRNARNGSAFTNDGPYPVKAGAWKASNLPVEPGCTCPCCARYTRGYVRHLLNTSEMLGYRLLTLHNIHCYLRFMERMRQAIANDCFLDFRAEAYARLREHPSRGQTH
ncbi:MAG: tRNA-guanine transglycosylase, partial [Lentisphaeraceae bacterium]|nr:tRNA-guanine transglycosylase [Lentisphaeraceae bacterium]